uniref:Nucleoside phosphorylase domain-containing protein n=1 Tax=Araucaria cunninghamii TaxID=56994 RepID=A0A0D6R5S5_ARACU
MEGKSAVFACAIVQVLLWAHEGAALVANKEALKRVHQINKEGPRIALVTVYPPEEAAFIETKVLIPHPKHPWVDLSGRRFRIGTIYGKRVVYVRCGVGMWNAGVTTQMLADLFNIAGVVHFGIAGNANNSLSIGDVTVPKYVAHLGIWEWLKVNGQTEANNVGNLMVGDYNVPQNNRTNLLGKISYVPEEFYSETGKPNVPEDLLFAETSSDWLKFASTIEGLKLESCLNKTVCLPRPANMVFGQRASTANIFVDNSAYRDFLVRHFHVSSVDEESAAVVMTCLSNKVKVIVFRGLSDLAGSQQGENAIHKFGPLAASNAVIATLEFIKEFPFSEL